MNETQSIDQKCINTIRTLSMDAVQAANSGHPGHADGPGAGGLLPLAELPPLRPRRPDLAQPRPLRPVGRPRLHAALFHAAPDRRQGGQQGIRDAGRAVGHAGGHQALPPARQQVPRPPRISLDLRRRDDHRAARPGRGHQRRHGHRRQVAGHALQQARLRNVRLQHLRHLRRRLHDGGHLRRSGVAGRPSAS